MRNDHERLVDMAEAIAQVQKYAARGRATFEQDELIRNWIRSHLQLLGEAARALSAEFREQYPEIPWSDIIGMRNILVHRYFGVDNDVVWSAVETRLPELQDRISAILLEMGGT